MAGEVPTVVVVAGATLRPFLWYRLSCSALWRRVDEDARCPLVPCIFSSSLRRLHLLVARPQSAAKVASTTPTRPLETPPYALCALLASVFVPPSPASPTSPSSHPDTAPASPQAQSRLGQLVSTVAQAGAAAAAGAAGAVTGAGGDARGAAAAATVRSVEAGAHRVWVGASDGRVRLYEVNEDSVDALAQGVRSPRFGSPATPGPKSPAVRPSACTRLARSY